MSLDITYGGDVSLLTMGEGAPAEIRARETGAHVHGWHWDGNLSRLGFDPGTATDLALTLRVAPRVPRLGKRAARIR